MVVAGTMVLAWPPRHRSISRGIWRNSDNSTRGISLVIQQLLQVSHLKGHFVGLNLNLHNYIITNACLSVHSNIDIKKVVIEKNRISIFPQSKQNLHPEGMPNLGEMPRDSGRIAQDNHMPRERLWPEWLKKVMNPVPIILGAPTKPEGIHERLWLTRKRASRV